MNRGKIVLCYVIKGAVRGCLCGGRTRKRTGERAFFGETGRVYVRRGGCTAGEGRGVVAAFLLI